jgi:flagellar basal-body rod protein FlgF
VIRSLDTAERAMRLEQVRIDALANNLANVNSAGFKQILTRVAQPEGLRDPEDPEGPQAPGGELQARQGGSPGAGDATWGPVTRMDLYHAVDNRRGPVAATGRDTDIAVMGRGFFELETPAGPAYTRNGSFRLDADRRLTTAGGLPVRGESGTITLDGTDFTIASDGRISVDGRPAGRLKLVDFDDPTQLEHMGDSVLRAPGFLEPQVVPADEIVVAQGHLEGSNVNPIDTLVDLITAQRAFEIQSKVLRAEDELLDKAVNTLPRVGA